MSLVNMGRTKRCFKVSGLEGMEEGGEQEGWFVAWAGLRSLCSQLSRGGGFTGLEASLSSCLGSYYNVFIAFHF